jgi:hypothetical protein
MAFTSSQLDEIGTWSTLSPELAEVRQEARRTYFAEDDPRPVHYWPGAGDRVSRDRRFLGWFLFSYRLPDGTQPAELAVKRRYRGSIQEEALQAVRNARYVLAIVTSTIWGRGVYLELEDERFDVRSAPWSHLLTRDHAVVTHLIPIRGPHVCLPGPGWLEWPIQIGPGMRQHLKRWQMDPLAVERLLQSRTTPEEENRAQEHPQDATLAQAVARMTEAAQKEGRTALILSTQEWAELVVQHMQRNSATSFAEEIVQRVGSVAETDEVNRWLGLGMNIWNTTPQPDRGGRTAQELLSGKRPTQEG